MIRIQSGSSRSPPHSGAPDTGWWWRWVLGTGNLPLGVPYPKGKKARHVTYHWKMMNNHWKER